MNNMAVCQMPCGAAILTLIAAESISSANCSSCGSNLGTWGIISEGDISWLPKHTWKGVFISNNGTITNASLKRNYQCFWESLPLALDQLAEAQFLRSFLCHVTLLEPVKSELPELIFHIYIANQSMGLPMASSQKASSGRHIYLCSF